MDYSSSLEFLYSLQFFGIKLGLENTRILLERLGNPQQTLRIVHIAGTNGKGSTAAALEQILRGAGQRTGLYTSPHLHSFTERIRIDGHPVDEDLVVQLTEECRRATTDLSPTFFEFTTAMALAVFARRKVDWVILETGLGGRLDATNIVEPELCIITPIAMDHAAHLGTTLEQIAAEKGGIIKPGVPVICARQETAALQTLQALADERGAAMSLAGRDFHWTEPPDSFSFIGERIQLQEINPGLAGSFQRENISLALAAAEKLNRELIDPVTTRETLRNLRWPGRLEHCGPVLLDGAHNPHAAQALSSYLAEESFQEMLWVVAIKSDKDVAGIMQPLLPFIEKIFAAPLETEEAIPPAELVQFARQADVAGELYETSLLALKCALEGRRPGQKVLVAGSLFLIAAVREYCLEMTGVGH